MPVNSGSSRIRFSWTMVLSAAALCFAVTAIAQESKKAADKEKPPDVSHLLKRFQKAGPEDDGMAKKLLAAAEQEAAKQNWNAAYKSYGDSIAKKPSVKGLLGEAVALSKMSKESPNCREELDSRFKFFEAAVKRLGEAVAFRHALGAKSDVDDKTIVQYQRRILESQQTLFEKQHECLAPDVKLEVLPRKPGYK